jgi:hypothetical protein
VKMDGFFFHLSEEFCRGRFYSKKLPSAFVDKVRRRAENQRETEVVGNALAFTGSLEFVGFADEVDGEV